jgi:alpha-1,6-mannosyltransferase
MAAVDIYVAPCSLETFGLSALEAMASGTPVLTANRGGVAETISRSGAGISFPAGDPNGLAETAIRLLQSDLTELGRKGREYVQTHHGWSMVFDRLFGLYRSILGA